MDKSVKEIELDEIMDKMQKNEISRLLNIIKEKEADIESLSKTLSGFYGDCKKYRDECKRLENKLDEKDAEIKRLKDAIQGAWRPYDKQ